MMSWHWSDHVGFLLDLNCPQQRPERAATRAPWAPLRSRKVARLFFIPPAPHVIFQRWRPACFRQKQGLQVVLFREPEIYPGSHANGQGRSSNPRHQFPSPCAKTPYPGRDHTSGLQHSRRENRLTTVCPDQCCTPP